MNIFPRWFLSALLMGFCLLSLSCRAEEAYPDLMPIGEIRGKVTEHENAEKHRARLNKETLTVRGVVHQLLRWRTMKGIDVYGMLIQNLPEDADGDAETSDGLFVYLGSVPALPMLPQGTYTARVGDVVTLRGTVHERYGQTEFSEAKVLAVKKGGDVDKLIEPVDLELPASYSARQRLLERHEGMRLRLSEGSVAVSGTHPNNRTYDMQLWVIPHSHPAVQAENKAARRQYRPAHPMSTVPEGLEKDGNGMFLVIGSTGLVERLDDRELSLPPTQVGQELSSALTGGMVYTWGEYVLQVDRLPVFVPASEEDSVLPAEEEAHPRLRIAAYNVENLYDFVNDPFDFCDFHDDSGCPGSRFPLNYVPETDEIYRARVRKIALQIVEDLHSPDILMIQEAEDQDVGKIVEGEMVYGLENNADGQIDALQEVALEIVAMGGPVYEVMVDRAATDGRGIICAWLVQTENFKAVDPSEYMGIFGDEPQLSEDRVWLPMSATIANPKAFNAVFTGVPGGADEMEAVFSRAVQVLLLEDKRNGERIWIQNNHFSSGPDYKVDRRRAQAAVNAELSQLILQLDPGATVLVGGDLNVFPRPDDPLDPPSDQLGPLYEVGLFNVYDRIVVENPANAYSYIYRGVANVLDHFFLSEAAVEKLQFAAYLKLNAGFPESFPNELPLRASDHDPLMIELAW
ncbi:hypothetical protein P3T73_08025 [Kiritimatiellota bacterium B12222]|nr:hypothetical protein P3T73_08025 [Kiritimatiellota bacterium B12222]